MLDNKIILSYHKFVEEPIDYRFSRTYFQFHHDLRKKVYDYITIDDGMRCMMAACMMMTDLKIRAKLFVCTGLVGKEGYCNWAEIEALSKFHDIENHGHIHEKHTEIDLKTMRSSIASANFLIHKHTGKTPDYFVGPFNQYNEAVEMAATEFGLECMKQRETVLNISK